MKKKKKYEPPKVEVIDIDKLKNAWKFESSGLTVASMTPGSGCCPSNCN